MLARAQWTLIGFTGLLEATVTLSVFAWALEARDHQVLETLLSRYAAYYQQAGLPGLRRRLEVDAAEGRNERLMIRVTDGTTAVVYSAEVGVEKPHPALFEELLEELRLPAAAVVHVGDSRRDDVEGAVAVGMRALWLTRGSPRGDLASLSELPARLLATPAGGAAGSRRW